MDDSISRQVAIDALADYIHNIDKVYSTGKLSAYDCKDAAESVIEQLPSAQQTLYGYRIEHLAYIARVMQKEGVTAEYAVRTFDDMSRALRMIIEEANERLEKTLSAMPGMSEVKMEGEG